MATVATRQRSGTASNARRGGNTVVWRTTRVMTTRTSRMRRMPTSRRSPARRRRGRVRPPEDLNEVEVVEVGEGRGRDRRGQVLGLLRVTDDGGDGQVGREGRVRHGRGEEELALLHPDLVVGEEPDPQVAVPGPG